VQHFEQLYLLHRAHLLRKYIERAEEQGEEFHVSDAFSPLQNTKVFAMALIRKINPSDSDPVLILRIRYRPGFAGGPAEALAAAGTFFAGRFTALPVSVETEAWTERVFYSPDVPKLVTLSPDDFASPPNDAPVAPERSANAPAANSSGDCKSSSD
jgi:hypothetical protein